MNMAVLKRLLIVSAVVILGFSFGEGHDSLDVLLWIVLALGIIEFVLDVPEKTQEEKKIE